MNQPALMIFGARRGVGLALAQAAREAGWAGIAVLRPGASSDELRDAGCQIRHADALDPAAVQACFAGLPAATLVVSSLGGQDARADDAGNRHVIDAARAHAAMGMLLVSSLGAGESREFASPRLLSAIGAVLEAKTRAEDHLRASGLDFAILRPGGLVDAPASQTGQLVRQQDVHGFIARAELARLILGLLSAPRLPGQTLAAIDPACPAPARYA